MGMMKKSYVIAGVKELQEVSKDDMWIKSPEGGGGGGRDVLDEDKYQKAFPRNTNRNHKLWTTEATRSVAFINKNHLNLADVITEYDWTFLFPNMVATEKTIIVFSTGSVDSPHGALQLVNKELQAAAAPIVANRKLTVLRTCLQMGEGTWVVAEITLNTLPSYCRRLPSGCLIERISDDESKVTWVEHTEVYKSLPNQTFCDHLIRSGFAFGAERMAAWLERFCEKRSHMDSTHSLLSKIQGTEVPWIREKIELMEFGDCMVRGLFQNISPNDNSYSAQLWSVTGSEDLKVHANLYNSYANFEVAGAVVAFHVKHSPEFVIMTVGDARKHHEWDVLGGYRNLYMPRQYSTGGDPMNNISASTIDGSSDMLIKEVNVNRSGSLVVWSTVSKEAFDLISLGKGLSEDSVLISGFSISTDGHTTATNTGGSVITLVLRMLVKGDQPLQEKRQQAIESITDAVNQTVKRVKEALDKQRPPSPRERLTDEQSKPNKKPKFLT